MNWEIKACCYDTLPNETLNDLMHAQAEVVGPMVFTDAEEKFAVELCQTVDPSVLAAAKKQVFGVDINRLLNPAFYNDKNQFGLTVGGSTDVGDISWIIPVGQILTTCSPLGVQVHTWQATASFGSSIGMKGMHYAAKIMALSGYDLMKDQNGILEKAKTEFISKTNGAEYKPGIPTNVKPPIPKAVPIPAM